MQNWARRGIQAALFTGGLLMLGTGIASADEQVDPDVPPSPLDGGVSVPVKVGNWTFGTPMGSETVPVFIDENISTGSALKDGSADGAPYFKGNVIAPNVLAPVEATGWAVAAGGNAHNVNESHETYSQGSDISTSGEGDGFAGNVVAPTAVTPAQATGIAFPLLGTATVENDTNQDSSAGGNVETNGDNGAGSGNIVAPQAAVPMAVNNTAAGWFAGIATATGSSTQKASADGTHASSGDGSVLGGNIAAAPASAPAHVDGTAGSWGGIATNNSANSAVAEAGTSGSGTRLAGTPYATTSGDDSLGGGNVATPQAAPLATVDCTAGAWGGMSTSECTDTNSTEAGGDVASSGDDAVVGGNIADAPVALPATVNHTAGAWGGASDAMGADTTSADAGGTTTTSGEDSALGGNIAGAPSSGPASVDCTAGAWGGIVSSECSKDTTSEAGNAGEGEDYATTAGDDSVGGGNAITAQPAPLAAVDCTAGVWGGITSTDCDTAESTEAGGGVATTGDDSTVGGNIIDGDAAVPLEAFDTAGAWGGDAESAGTKTVLADAGGQADTSGVESTGGGNTVRPQLASPGAVDCNAGVWGGEASSECITDSSADAGGTTHSNGDDSVIGGNTAEAPLAPVAAVSGNAGSFIGDAESLQENTTAADAGGNTFSQGDDSVLGGNTATTPAAAAGEVLCVAGTTVGEAECDGSNDVDANAGGYTGTTGDDSLVGGNVATVPMAPVAEAYGIAGAWGGDSTSTFGEEKTVTAGGDSTSNDDRGTVSSNVAAVPLAPAAQVSNIAAAWVGKPTSVVDSDTENTAGGDLSASANESVASGNIFEGSGALPADVHTVAATWVGNATAIGTHETDSTAGGDATTTSVNAPASGNVISGSGAGAANAYGWAGSWVGNNLAQSDKTLTSTSGGDTTTNGDNSALAGNQVLADANPVAGAFGNTGSFIASDTADTTSDTAVTSGGDALASGNGGNGSGNVAQADAQPLAEVFGINAAAVGSTMNSVDKTTTATNSGDVETSGIDGNLAGDIVDADAQAPWQVFGVEGSALGHAVNSVGHETTTTNSGTNTAAGDGGNLAGNVVNGDAQGPAQIYGMDAAAVGNGANSVADSLEATNGGGTEASGTDGQLAGNVLSAEGQALPHVLGWGVSAAGDAAQGTTGDTTASNGGDITTAGDGESSGHVFDVLATANPATHAWAASVLGDVTNLTDKSQDASNGGIATSAGGEVVQIPLGLTPEIHEVEIPVGGAIDNVHTNNPITTVGPGTVVPVGPGSLPARSDHGMDLPAAPADLPVSASVPTVGSGVPGLPGVDGMPAVPGLDGLPAVPGLDGLPALPGLDGLPALPGLDGLPALPGLDGLGGLPAVPVSRDLPAMPAVPGVDGLPAVPGLDGLPAVPGLDGLPALPGLDGLPAVPGLDGLPALPGLDGLGGLPAVPVSRDLPAMPAVPGVDGLPAVPGVDGLPAVPGLDGLPALPGLDGLPAVPGLDGLPALPGLDGLGGLPAVPVSRDLPAMPAVPGVDGLPAVPGVDGLPAVPGLDGLPAVPGLDGLPAVPDAGQLPTLPATPETPFMQGFEAGMEAAQRGMAARGGALPLTPQVDMGQTNLPDAGSISGTLPMGDLQAPAQVPALSGLDTARLHSLLGGVDLP